MPRQLRVLHVEDSADDGELLRLELEAAGYSLRYRRVDSADSLAAALAGESWDVVLSDFNLPGLDAYGALAVLRQAGQDLPFIVVSGFIGEIEAVNLMKAGVHDYFMKGQLARLGPAIERAIGDAADRAARRRSVAELAESRRQLQELSAFLQQVREDEGTRIARELHDELGQVLTALRIDLIWVEGQLGDSAPKVRDKLASMRGLVDQTVDTVRRISEDLRPGMLDDLGLAAAIEHHVDRFATQTGIACRLVMDREDYTLDDRTATTLYRLLQEALTNVARHAGATQVDVHLEEAGGSIRLRIKDDGRGLPAPDSSPSAPRKRSYGLLGMRERVRLLAGTIDITGAPGAGTLVDVSLPLAASPPQESPTA